jgi:type IV secretion system protein VirD4
MLLDEFTALGRIPIVAEAISYLPGYNVRVLLVIQTPAQLREVYGLHNAETMLKSLAARIVFAPKDVTDAREISDELGFTTVKVRSTSKPMLEPFAASSRGRSQTESLQRRALLLPQEVKELPASASIVFYEGLRPIRATKIRYFAERAFRRRLRPAPERAESALARHAAEVRARPPAPELEPQRDTTGATTRPAMPADVERIDALRLEDLDLEVADLAVPETAAGERLSAGDLDALADRFLVRVG